MLRDAQHDLDAQTLGGRTGCATTRVPTRTGPPCFTPQAYLAGCNLAAFTARQEKLGFKPFMDKDGVIMLPVPLGPHNGQRELPLYYNPSLPFEELASSSRRAAGDGDAVAQDPDAQATHHAPPGWNLYPDGVIPATGVSQFASGDWAIPTTDGDDYAHGPPLTPPPTIDPKEVMDEPMRSPPMSPIMMPWEREDYEEAEAEERDNPHFFCDEYICFPNKEANEDDCRLPQGKTAVPRSKKGKAQALARVKATAKTIWADDEEARLDQLSEIAWSLRKELLEHWVRQFVFLILALLTCLLRRRKRASNT